MRAKQLLQLLIAGLIALPGIGVIQAQSGTLTPISCAGMTSVAAGTSQQIIQSGGLTRTYRLFVPSGYDPSQPTPLVISLHGYASNALEQEAYTRWDNIAESETFLAVYPNGTGVPQRWNEGQRGIPGLNLQGRSLLAQFLGGFFEVDSADDVGFTRDLIAQLSSELCIDPARIYVNGISNGGGMTYRLACQLSDEIAAAGMVDGSYVDFGGCDPTRAVPIIAFHGKADPIVPYDGYPLIGFPPIETWVADWATRDQCDPTPQPIAGTVGAVTGVRYIGCADNAEVDFYAIADGGHTWPGATPVFPGILGKTSQDIDATQTMWAFFKAHPMG